MEILLLLAVLAVAVLGGFWGTDSRGLRDHPWTRPDWTADRSYQHHPLQWPGRHA